MPSRRVWGRLWCLSKAVTDVCCEQDLEHYWLASSPFVAGDDISIADLIIVMELTQLQMLEGALQARSSMLVKSRRHSQSREPLAPL